MPPGPATAAPAAISICMSLSNATAKADLPKHFWRRRDQATGWLCTQTSVAQKLNILHMKYAAKKSIPKTVNHDTYPSSQPGRNADYASRVCTGQESPLYEQHRHEVRLDSARELRDGQSEGREREGWRRNPAQGHFDKRILHGSLHRDPGAMAGGHGQ